MFKELSDICDLRLRVFGHMTLAHLVDVISRNIALWCNDTSLSATELVELNDLHPRTELLDPNLIQFVLHQTKFAFKML